MIPVTTAKASIVRTEADERGWRGLTRAPGEPHGADVPEGEVLACLWHLSDLHLCDAESPARLEYLDRLADPDSPLADEIGEVGTYRPQEILTVQVAVQMVHTVNRISRGPVTGSHVDAVLITGDVTDNCQQNELAWYRTGGVGSGHVGRALLAPGRSARWVRARPANPAVRLPACPGPHRGRAAAGALAGPGVRGALRPRQP